MPRVAYEQSAIDAIIRLSAAARLEGKQWKEALVIAKEAGYAGSESGLQKLVRAHAPVGRPAKSRPAEKSTPRAGYKNSAKIPSTNAFHPATDSTTPNLTTDASDESSSVNTLESICNRLAVLRDGTYFDRPISLFEGSFQSSRDGEIVAWSRILKTEEAVWVANSHVQYTRGADILVDSTLNPPGSFLTVIHSAEQSRDGAETHYPIGCRIPVQRRGDGTAFIAIRDVPPAMTLLLISESGLNGKAIAARYETSTIH